MSILGTRVVRIEDPRLLTAGGTYVDDLRVPQLTGAARVTFVRSHHGHALITGIDASAALAAPGVIAVLTYTDINDLPPPPPPPDEPAPENVPLPLGGVWQVIDVGDRQHGDHARRRQRRRGVDAGDPGVPHRAAHERDPCRSRQLGHPDIVHIGPADRQQLRVFGPHYPGTHDAHCDLRGL